jgi:PAS domain S-box-containing protein
MSPSVERCPAPTHQPLAHRSLRPGGQFAGRLLIVLVAVLAAIPILANSQAPFRDVRRVLVVSDISALASPRISAIDNAVISRLESSPYQIELYSESLEAILFPDERSQRRIRDWLIRTYEDRRPDLIITIGPDSLRFLAEIHQAHFTKVPVVFCGTAETMLDDIKLDANFTGIWGVPQPDKTLEAALRLQPGTKHVAVVGGVGNYDRQLEAIARQSLRKYEPRLDFTYLTDLDMPTLLDRLKHLPPDTVVVHTSVMRDAEGARFSNASQSVPMIVAAANAPVFVMTDVTVGSGAVGGDVISFPAEGQAAGDMAVRILKGEKAARIPIQWSASVYVFDGRALHRWGLSERNLPTGSIELNRQPTAWESYKRFILGGGTLIVLQTALIAGLLWHRRYRRKAEAELALTYERLRLSVEAAKSVAWDWDLKTGRNIWFGDLKTMFGIDSVTHSGTIEEFRRRIHPDDRETASTAVADARETGAPFTAEFRVLRQDGSVRWVVVRGKFDYGQKGEPQRMLGMATDISDRKIAEREQSVSENRFRQFFETVPEYCYMISPAGEILDVNPATCAALGYSRDELIGKMVRTLYAPEFVQEATAVLDQWTTEGSVRGKEIVVVTKDGQRRTVLLYMGAVKDVDGKVLHSASVQVDITERRRAEETLRRSEEYSREIILRSPVAMVVTRDPDQRCEIANHKFTELFGYSIDDIPDVNHWWPLAYPDPTYREAMKAEWKVRVNRALTLHTEMKPMEARVCCKDGSYRHVEFHFSSLGDTSLTSFVDLTGRRNAEVNLRESEERFRLVANSAPVMIWMSGPDRLCNYFNQGWLDFTGRSIEDEMGNGWADGVHPDDLDSCFETYVRSFDRRDPFRMQYRLRRRDGEYRWVVDIGVPRFHSDSTFAGYIGSCLDITERKMAEEALTSLSGRLIEAQEEERRRIAREIHDDFQQRLAIISIDLEDIAQNVCSPGSEPSLRLHELWHHVSELGADLHSLSHRLHSSTLDRLGLVAGLRSLCNEFTEHHGIVVTLVNERVPRHIPSDVALCLFRVTQEALQNVKKHSGSPTAEVRVEWKDSQIRLLVSDQGRGFDPTSASRRAGIGLRSMEERLRLVGGHLAIHARLMQGTTIEAAVPIAVGVPASVQISGMAV